MGGAGLCETVSASTPMAPCACKRSSLVCQWGHPVHISAWGQAAVASGGLRSGEVPIL